MYGVHPVIYLLSTVIGLYSFIVFAMVIVSLLVSFRVVNTNNMFVYKLHEILFKLTEPALRPIRNMMPDLGGLDISPVILLVLLNVLDYTLLYYFS